MPPRSRFVALAVLAATLILPARAAAVTSSNWAGYVAHAPGTKFRTVRGAWTVPAVDCSSPRKTYSAAWIGLGGYHSSSNALEQTGTEADCRHGIPRYGAWYELVPDAEVVLPMAVQPGDQMAARVSVRGTRAIIRIANRTRGTTYRKTVQAPAIDITSADWIMEAPSQCGGLLGPCRILPLANFGTMAFTSARAVTTTGHQGVIGDPAWVATPIDLGGDTLTIGTTEDEGGGTGGATAGGLTPSGAGFSVAYAPAG
jgi:hypothetical protein